VKKGKRQPKRVNEPATAQRLSTAGKQEYRVMTVALIREPKETEAVEVAFSESARFYRLLRANQGFDRILTALREAKEKKRPVRVMMESPESNVIWEVEAGV
jgi:hypothetical protein